MSALLKPHHYSTFLKTCLMGATLALISPANAAERVAEFSVERCDEDYEDVDFCSEQSLQEYRKAMKNPEVNFNRKYILHFFTPSDEGFQEVVAIDPASHRVYLTNIEIRPSATPDFSINGDTFCFYGDIYGYRNADDDNTFCYQLTKDDYSEFGVGFSRIYD